jgi:hypothetical protein
MNLRALFCSGALLLFAGGARGADVAAVLSGDSGPYLEALEGLKAVVGPVDSATLPAVPNLAGAKVIVTFGSEAALRDYPGSAPLVAALLPDPKVVPKHAGGLTRVGLPPAAAVLAARIKALQPSAADLAVLDPQGAYADYLAELKTAAPAAGLNLGIRRVDKLADLASKLPGIKGSAQALWIPPDPLFMNPKTFMLIAQFCRGAGIGFYAPVASLARLGVLAGLAPSFNQQGRAAGAAAQAWIAGTNPGAWVYSAKVECTVNKTVAAELGISAAALRKADNLVE